MNDQIPNDDSQSSLVMLIGYRGTGKTVVGRKVAKALGYHFADSDDVVEERSGHTIADIFANQGEPAFRKIEESIISELCHRKSTVVSLGGGAVVRSKNRNAIAASGAMVVWLTAQPETLFRRIIEDATTAARRPALTNDVGIAEIERLIAVRTPLYQECATFEVDTENYSPEAVAKEILARFNDSG